MSWDIECNASCTEARFFFIWWRINWKHFWGTTTSSKSLERSSPFGLECSYAQPWKYQSSWILWRWIDWNQFWSARTATWVTMAFPSFNLELDLEGQYIQSSKHLSGWIWWWGFDWKHFLEHARPSTKSPERSLSFKLEFGLQSQYAKHWKILASLNFMTWTYLKSILKH